MQPFEKATYLKPMTETKRPVPMPRSRHSHRDQTGRYAARPRPARIPLPLRRIP